jgi:hypothetical protein
MVNKADPDAAVDAFEIDTLQLLADWIAIDDALKLEKVALRRRVATDALLRLAVTWEAFLSDWWVSAVNRDPGPLLGTLDGRMRKFARDNCGLTDADLSATLVTRSHFNVDDIRRLLDPDKRNIVVRSHRELREKAGQELADPYRMEALGISKSDWAVADLVRTTRNALAHRSGGSFDELHRALRSRDLRAPLKLSTTQTLNVAGIGRYLGAKPTGTNSERIAMIHDDLRCLGVKLRI